MSWVKWWPTQQAFPRSAILTEMMSRSGSSAELLDEDLSNEMPDTSRSKRSLFLLAQVTLEGVLSDVRCLLSRLLLLILLFDAQQVLHRRAFLGLGYSGQRVFVSRAG